jgi:multicomponent Na+:H+ antiporter subunit E
MRRITLFVVSFVLWWLMSWPYNFRTGRLDLQALIAGAVVSLAASLLFVEVFTKGPGKFFNPRRWLWGLLYIPVFLWAMLRANLDVLYRIIHPRLPIRPGIVKVRTTLTSEAGRTALANSITLTPGTMSVDIRDDGTLYIHWINVQAEDMEGATRKIVAQFERFLTRIFE